MPPSRDERDPMTTANTRPATSSASSWRNQYHFTVPDKWMNDPQRPVWLDGAYQFFYLYNAEYPEDHGTAWRRASTTDGVRFVDHGVALAKDTQPNGSLWSGSMVVDHHNTAGFGHHAVIALITQTDRVGADGAQAQFLWYSVDNARTFANLGDTPVLPNPGHPDFRDPKIIRDHSRDQWVCVLAEGHELGLYTSLDLQAWHQVSRFREARYGVLECPDFFLITADDDRPLWVLAASVQKIGDANPGTYAYWTGDFDGATFTPLHDEPEWLDHGFDWYAAVTWPANRHDDGPVPDTRWAIGWMNNWAYAHRTPTLSDEDFNGVDSIVRQIRLHRDHDRCYRLRSTPVPPLDPEPPLLDLTGVTLDQTSPLEVRSRSFQIELTIHNPGPTPSGLRVRMSEDQRRYIEIGVTENMVYIDRSRTGEPSGGAHVRTSAPVENRSDVRLRIFIDHTTIEVFVDNGRYTLSNLVFPPPTDLAIATFGASPNQTADIVISPITASAT